MNVALSIPDKLQYIGCLNAGESVAVEDATVAIKAASGQAGPSPGSEDDIDGCDVEVEVPTADEDLPPAEGGVA